MNRHDQHASRYAARPARGDVGLVDADTSRRYSIEVAMQTVPRIIHPDVTMSGNKRVLADLLASLTAAGATHALIGGLAAGYHGKARATVDVDMLIPRRAATAVREELERRGYEVRVSEDMMRAYRPGNDEAVADLVWREAHPVLKAAAAKTVPATILGLPVNLVKRGAFVALKYHAASSPTRQHMDKYQDVIDIGRVLAKSFTAADEKMAVAIAEKAYPGCGRHLAQLLDDIRHERPVKV
jgi:hypothetical protein